MMIVTIFVYLIQNKLLSTTKKLFYEKNNTNIQSCLTK